MNNRYIFRGKRKDNGEWVVGYYYKSKYYRSDEELCDYITIPHPDIENAPSDNFIVIPETVGQCTGLKDKNGKLIFEGDVVSDAGGFVYGKVVYATAQDGYDGMAGFMIDDVNNGLQNYDGFWHCVDILGNIHDNPELLEAEK